MTRDDIIRMAREAGFAIDVSTDPNSPPSWWGAGHKDRFKAFTELVRADEREKWEGQTAVEVHEAILDEREACAKVCEERGQVKGGEVFAARIRARGQA